MKNLFVSALAPVLLGAAGTVLAAAGDPVAAPFTVNTYTLGDQQHPVVARSAAGVVVVWDSNRGGGNQLDIYARLYAPDGTPRGDEFLVNQFTDNIQTLPAVAMNDAGEFVVAWDSNGPAARGVLVMARRFGPDGTPRGDEFQVDDQDRDVAFGVTAAIAPGGAFVVAWPERVTPGGISLLKLSFIGARVYSADLQPVGASFEAGTSMIGTLRVPEIGMAADGSIVVAWAAAGRGGFQGPAAPGAGVYVRRFNADGSGKGLSEAVDTANALVDRPALAVAPDGSFVIAWEQLNEDATLNSIQAARYSSKGKRLGSRFVPDAAKLVRSPRVAIDSLGDFVIAGSSDGIYARRYAADGSALGDTLRADLGSLPNTALVPDAGMDATGNFVIAWQTWNEDGSRRGVKARLFSGP
jgi:hypothetical protein